MSPCQFVNKILFLDVDLSKVVLNKLSIVNCRVLVASVAKLNWKVKENELINV